MKDFKDMSQTEISNLSESEWKAVSPFDKKSCADCASLTYAVHLWCSNEEAMKFRGTNIPGCIKCPFWCPKWNEIPKEYRTEANGYVEAISKMDITSVKLLYKYTFIDKLKNLLSWILKR